MDTLSLKSLAVLLFIYGTAIAQSPPYAGIQEVGSLKRGKEYSIRWSGGLKDHKINITLQNSSGELVQSWTDLVNDGEHTLKLNPNLKPQRGYVLDITISGNGVISSSDIRIRRRIPLVVTISTVVIVPVAALLITRDTSPGQFTDAPAPPQ